MRVLHRLIYKLQKWESSHDAKLYLEMAKIKIGFVIFQEAIVDFSVSKVGSRKRHLKFKRFSKSLTKKTSFIQRC